MSIATTFQKAKPTNPFFPLLIEKVTNYGCGQNHILVTIYYVVDEM